MSKTDHASGLRQLKDVKNILVSTLDLEYTKKYPIRYVKSMREGIDFQTFNFENTCDGKFVLLFSDGGYSKKSYEELIPLGTALDDELAMKSLKWIREASLNENCIESLANHDAEILPHVIEF